LHYLRGRAGRLDQFWPKSEPILDGNWSLLNLGHMPKFVLRLEAGARAPNDPANLALDAKPTLQHQLAHGPGAWRTLSVAVAAMPQSFATLSELSGEYLLTKEGKLRLCNPAVGEGERRVRPRYRGDEALRDLIAQMSARHPETKIA